MSRPAPMCRTCGHRHYNLSPCPDQAQHPVPFVPSDRPDRTPAGFHVKKEFGDPDGEWGNSAPPGWAEENAAIPIYRPTPRLRTGRLTLPSDWNEVNG